MKRFPEIIIALLFAQPAIAQDTPLSLKDAVQTALQKNLGIVLVKNEAEIAKINNNWGNAGALPVVSASLSRSFASSNIQQVLSNGTEIKRDGAAVNNFNAGALLSWRFFDGMRMFASKSRLEELQKIGAVQISRQSNQIVYNTLFVYYNLIRLRQQAHAVREMIALNQERLKIAEARYTIGTGAKPEVLQAKVDLNEQQQSLLSLENETALSVIQLNQLLLQDPKTKINITDTVFEKPTADFAQLSQQISTANPDVLLAQSNLRILKETKREINAQRLPSGTFTSNYNFVRSKSEAGFNLLNQNYGPSVAVGIAIPIFNGGIVRQQLKVNDIQRKNQELSIQDLEIQLKASFETALSNFNNAQKMASMEEANLELIRENNLINLERFRKMAITSVELRQSQTSYTDAQTRLSNARYQMNLAEAQMQLLAGSFKF